MGIGTNDEKQNTGLAIRLHIHHSENSRVLGRPNLLVTELESVQDSKDHPLAPLPYFTDAIVGLSALKLMIHTNDAITSNEEALAALLWQRLEPMHEVYQRSYQRIKPLLNTKASETLAGENFETSLRDIVKLASTEDGIDLAELLNLIDSLNFLETKRAKPLLFDTTIQISSGALNLLHTLYSLLYNLRALSAIHYNSKQKDTLFEVLQIDNVKDYFHAPDLLTNETMLYYHYLSLRKHGLIAGSGDDSLGHAFRNYLPHSHYLVNSLPDDFFSRQNSELLEQSLYTFQIDWLLGSPAGLLYRLREELIGLKEGYEHTFWPELHNAVSEEPIGILHVDCVLGADHIRQLSDAA
jgi:hypothetical protein